MSPAMIFALVDRLGRTPKTPSMKLAYESIVIVAALTLFLPASISLFPQTDTASRNELEAELREAASGKPIEVVYFNKGL